MTTLYTGGDSMANANLKTKKTAASVSSFIDKIKDEKRKNDCLKVLALMQSAVGAEPKMWGENVVGFGDYHYKYESGRENDWFMTGFSPRKENLTLYFMTGFAKYGPLLAKLGKHKTGKGCLYIKDLDDVDTKVLSELISCAARDLSNQQQRVTRFEVERKSKTK
jgi:hypothetical protein